jgi:hypothetical protein
MCKFEWSDSVYQMYSTVCESNQLGFLYRLSMYARVQGNDQQMFHTMYVDKEKTCNIVM